MTAEPEDYRLVADQRVLDEIRERIVPASRVAVDTEFIRERTYYPRLCVLQIATTDVIAAIDCLAPLEMSAFLDTLLDDDKSWVLHSARQDLEVVWHLASRLPSRLIDTQIAAALLGKPMQIGLQGLVDEILGVGIGKEHTRADWSRRPLPDAVLDYALDDVRYLLPLADALTAQLDSLGRLDWFEEDCARVLAQPIDPDAPALLERTKGTGGMNARKRAAALALIEWREARARAADKPRRWILPDDQLVAIALRRPATVAELDEIEGLHAGTVRRSGKAILAALSGAGEGEETPQPATPDRARVKAVQAAVRERAEALGIQPEVLATRRDIAAAATGCWPDAIARGWRGAILEDVDLGIS